MGYRGTSLVTKLTQVNKTVFVFFPCFNSYSPGSDDCILHSHPIVAALPLLHTDIAPCLAQHVINYTLSLCTESVVVYILVASLFKPRF